MIMFVVFLMLLSYGLGFFTEVIVRNIKELDDIVEKNKLEEKMMLEHAIAPNQQEPSHTSPTPSDINKLKRNLTASKK